MSMPLSDLLVLDLTVARAGPTCVRQLSDWGADVLRVEAPPAGGSAEGLLARHGSDFQNLHRNKRSLTLDLTLPAAREVLFRLVDRADVLVENMRPAVKYRLGFDYEIVHARNPRLVYGSISGFGQDGPYADRGGVDQIAQGMGGLMSVTGVAGGEPMRVGIPVSDLSAGLYLAIGILVALHDRQRSGLGRWVQTSLLESMVAMMDFQAARWTVDGEVPAAEGNHHPTLIPMGCFACADGFVNIAGPSGRLWQRFCQVIGRPDLLADVRFGSARARSTNRAELNAIITEQLRQRGTTEWVRLLNDAGVPCGPVYRMDEVFADPQVERLRMTAPVEHSQLGRLELIRNAVRMTDQSETVRFAAPGAGEHTDSVLEDLGYTPDEIGQLHAGGAVERIPHVGE
jgi:crotonobetainyl-CoA:carnitine CoA-transferase CaiB-like acyl-CoA transferase